MGKIIAVAIHKGGTGKTTVAINLCHYASKQGLKVLVVDMDPQENMTSTVLQGASPVPECLTASMLFQNDQQGDVMSVDGLSIIPADQGLLGVESLAGDADLTVNTIRRYRSRLRVLAADFDLVVVDTPPSMGFGMLVPLIAADYVVSPVLPDAFSFKGVESMVLKVRSIRAKENPHLQFIGLLVNRYNRRNSDQCKAVAALQDALKNNVLPNTLGDRSAIANAIHRGVPVWVKPKGGAAKIAAREVKKAMKQIIDKAEIM